MAIPKYHDILVLHYKGVSNTEIAKVTGSSRTTVIRAVSQSTSLELNLPAVEGKSDRELKDLLYPKSTTAQKPMADVEYLEREMGANKDVTLRLLWLEYLEDCKRNKKAPLMYSRFCHHYRQHAQSKKVSGHVQRESGFSVEVDWGGTPMHWVDEESGEIKKAFLFLGCLSYSRYFYCEAFDNEQMENWLAAHVNMFEFFGGSTKIIICDNLKTGVVKHIKGEIKINLTYQDLARHYSTVISPARNYDPKGKPNVEDSVKSVAKRIIAALRRETFYSLVELNEAIMGKLKHINAQPFQKREGSRKLLYEQVELSDLQNLPATPFEMAEWYPDIKVHFNYHIGIGKYFHYSVPYQYAGRTVSARQTLSVVEIFLNHTRIATHQRNYNKRRAYTTDRAHMPPAQQEASMRWNDRRFISWAQSIGPNTLKVVIGALNSKQVIQQAYPSCLALLNLSTKVSTKALEEACTKVVEGGLSPTYSNVKNILGVKDEAKPQNSHQPKKVNGLVRGVSYFEAAAKKEVHND